MLSVAKPVRVSTCELADALLSKFQSHLGRNDVFKSL